MHTLASMLALLGTPVADLPPQATAHGEQHGVVLSFEQSCSDEVRVLLGSLPCDASPRAMRKLLGKPEYINRDVTGLVGNRDSWQYYTDREDVVLYFEDSKLDAATAHLLRESHAAAVLAARQAAAEPTLAAARRPGALDDLLGLIGKPFNSGDTVRFMLPFLDVAERPSPWAATLYGGGVHIRLHEHTGVVHGLSLTSPAYSPDGWWPEPLPAGIRWNDALGVVREALPIDPTDSEAPLCDGVVCAAKVDDLYVKVVQGDGWDVRWLSFEAPRSQSEAWQAAEDEAAARADVERQHEEAALAATRQADAECKLGDCVNGFGMLQHADWRYSGNFSVGLFHGSGALTRSDGDIEINGEWAEGQPVGDVRITVGPLEWVGGQSGLVPHGQGTWTGRHNNLSLVLAGEAYEGQPTGTWTVSFDGETYSGVFRSNLWRPENDELAEALGSDLPWPLVKR